MPSLVQNLIVLGQLASMEKLAQAAVNLASTFWMIGFQVLLVTATDFVLFERFDSFILFVLMLIFNADLRLVFWVLLGDCCLFFVF